MTGSGMAEPSDWVNSDAGHVLTERQQLILGVISDFAGRRGYAPTLREIAKATGLASPSSVSYQLTILQDKGYLRRDPGRPRTIEMRLPGQPAVRLEVEDLADRVATPASNTGYSPVPLVGDIHAGVPDLAEEVIEDVWELPRELVGDGTLFRLRVHGDSMVNAAIMDGDIVVVRQQGHAENGEMVAAMIDGEATVKTFRQAKDQVWLIAHNPAYTPIPGEEAQILGRVVSVLRRI